MEDEDTLYPSDHELFDSSETCFTMDMSSYSEESVFDTIQPVIDYELNAIKRLKQYLSGIPPPPNVTAPKHDLDELLNVWNNTVSNLSDDTNISSCSNFSSNQGIVRNTMDDILRTYWPDVKNCQFFDIYYNKSKHSEKLASLYEKYRERFVSCETSSFISLDALARNNANNRASSSKKTISPSKIVSYLIKRKKTFTCETFQSFKKSSTSHLRNWRNRLITDAKKAKVSEGYLRECTNSLYEWNKVNQQSTATSFADVNYRNPTAITAGAESSNCSKANPKQKEEWARLFKSSSPASKKRCSKKPRLLSDSKKTDLCGNDPRNENKICSVDISNFTLFKSTSSQDYDEGTDVISQTLLTKLQQAAVNSKCHMAGGFRDLTYSQKLKLLWAVSTALKTIGIGSEHKNFKLYGQRLFKLCKKVWLADPANEALKRGISDRMTKLACDQVNNVIDDFKMRGANVDLFSQDSNSTDNFFANHIVNKVTV